MPEFFGTPSNTSCSLIELNKTPLAAEIQQICRFVLDLSDLFQVFDFGSSCPQMSECRQFFVGGGGAETFWHPPRNFVSEPGEVLERGPSSLEMFFSEVRQYPPDGG